METKRQYNRHGVLHGQRRSSDAPLGASSEMAVAVIMGSATHLSSITRQDMWSAHRRHLRLNVTVISGLPECDSGTTIKPQPLRLQDSCFLACSTHPHKEHNISHKQLNVILCCGQAVGLGRWTPRTTTVESPNRPKASVKKLGLGSCRDFATKVFQYVVWTLFVSCHALP